MDEERLYSEPEETVEDEEQGMFEHFRLNVDPGQTPMRVDKFMATHLEDTSRHRVQLAIKEGYVKVGDKTAKANLIVRPGDVIRFMMPYRRRGTEIIPQDIPLDIVYEDDDLLVVNKPAGMVVHPGHGNYDGTLVNALAFHLSVTTSEAAPLAAEDERMGVLVHRIDKDTSGLLVVAKNDEAQMDLAKQFFEHSIERLYVAVVWGNVKDDEGTIDAAIGRDPNDRLRFKVYPEDDERAKHAVTHYKVLERFGYVTVIQCRLETGRTHQIRVHMSHIGHPLVGDELYGGLFGYDVPPAWMPRQALHAQSLELTQPVSGERIRAEAPVPADIARCLEHIRSLGETTDGKEDHNPA